MPVTRYWRLAAGTGLAAASALAAARSDEAIAECSRLSTAEARILCLDDVMRSLSGEETISPAPEAGAPVAEPAEAVPLAATTSIPEVDDEVIVAPAPANEVPPEPAPFVAEERAGVPTAKPVETAASGLGAEQLAARSGKRESPDRVQATVVAFDFVRRDKLRVTLDNGQVWRQTDADRPNHYRSLRRMESFEVEMWETGLGGYRMLIKPTNKMVRVQRIK